MRASAEVKGKVVLITGATGSFGTAFVRELLDHHEPAAVRIYSRDELKQSEMAARWPDNRLRFLIGDVRDRDRLSRALRGVDLVVHAAALKHVPVCEYNPFEAVQTNVIGTENVVSAAIENRVPKTIALSTDKAVNPVNLYGATKLCAEKLMSQGNSYVGDLPVRFSSVRYGNVVGSRGSVIPAFIQQAQAGELTITDDAMTRFWITLPQAVAFVLACVERMRGGEVFVPKIPSMRVADIAEALAPGIPRNIVGVRPGEKIHEVLITGDEARHAIAFDDHFVIRPAFPFWEENYPHGDELGPGFHYSSDSNDFWLTVDQLREMAGVISVSG